MKDEDGRLSISAVGKRGRGWRGGKPPKPPRSAQGFDFKKDHPKAPIGQSVEKERPSVATISPKRPLEIVVNYYDERIGRIVIGGVTLKKYVELWKRGYLSFQQRGLQKPEHLPGLEEVCRMIADE